MEFNTESVWSIIFLLLLVTILIVILYFYNEFISVKFKIKNLEHKVSNLDSSFLDELKKLYDNFKIIQQDEDSSYIEDFEDSSDEEDDNKEEFLNSHMLEEQQEESQQEELQEELQEESQQELQEESQEELQEEAEQEGCKHIMINGKRKGQICGKKCKNNERCVVHSE